MLCYAMLDAMLYAMLCYAMLCFATLCYCCTPPTIKLTQSPNFNHPSERHSPGIQSNPLVRCETTLADLVQESSPNFIDPLIELLLDRGQACRLRRLPREARLHLTKKKVAK